MKRTIFVMLVTVTMAAALVAQRGPGGPGALGGRDPVAALKNALGLTDAQVTAITALFQAEPTRVQAIRTEIEQRRTALDTLLNSASPAPVNVGNAAIALHASELNLKAEQDSFISQVKQQLTGEQQQKLDTFLAANGGRLLPGLGGPGRGGPRGRGERSDAQ
jgi:Spy/CpxP family protein refolding chaperone